uniref:Uncharacterized protein n=1 Tax=uncultured bacterium esnapd13 TaxID=1366593 RepID=S5UB97_9BACT|nr:hypothetical protein [uncultured bacterium esnapd13]
MPVEKSVKIVDTVESAYSSCNSEIHFSISN